MTSVSEPARVARAVPAARGEARSIDDRLLVVSGLAAGAGLIHVVAAFQHLDEYAWYALFFVVLAIAQLTWGVALYRAPTRRLMTVGAVGAVLVVLLWVASRTAGLPIGPSPWSPEAVGLTDSVASADELVIAVLILCELAGAPTRPLAIGLRRSATAVGLWLVLLSSLALVGVEHAH
jgi:hypothetical protein